MTPPWIIEEHRRREQERERSREPIPLHAPRPMAPERAPEPQGDRTDTGSAGTVIIIDIGDYSETRI